MEDEYSQIGPFYLCEESLDGKGTRRENIRRPWNRIEVVIEQSSQCLNDWDSFP